MAQYKFFIIIIIIIVIIIILWTFDLCKYYFTNRIVNVWNSSPIAKVYLLSLLTVLNFVRRPLGKRWYYL